MRATIIDDYGTNQSELPRFASYDECTAWVEELETRMALLPKPGPTKRLVTDGTQWLISFREDPEADEIYRLFGTYEVPTPFLVTFPRGQVVVALAKLGTVVA